MWILVLLQVSTNVYNTFINRLIGNFKIVQIYKKIFIVLNNNHWNCSLWQKSGNYT